MSERFQSSSLEGSRSFFFFFFSRSVSILCFWKQLCHLSQFWRNTIRRHFLLRTMLFGIHKNQLNMQKFRKIPSIRRGISIFMCIIKLRSPTYSGDPLFYMHKIQHKNCMYKTLCKKVLEGWDLTAYQYSCLVCSQ